MHWLGRKRPENYQIKRPLHDIHRIFHLALLLSKQKGSVGGFPVLRKVKIGLSFAE
jgi:hypothetical protein